MKKLLALLFVLLLALSSATFAEALFDGEVAVTDDCVVEYGLDYSETDEVALYLHVFQELPPNFLTKSEAREWGWVSREGNLWDVAYGMSIGGDVFGNREGLLPEACGRTWYECDVNYFGGFRGDDRILYSDDGLIYFTEDHYNTFEQLYDGWYEWEEEEASGWNLW